MSAAMLSATPTAIPMLTGRVRPSAAPLSKVSRSTKRTLTGAAVEEKSGRERVPPALHHALLRVDDGRGDGKRRYSDPPSAPRSRRTTAVARTGTAARFTA